MYYFGLNTLQLSKVTSLHNKHSPFNYNKRSICCNAIPLPTDNIFTPLSKFSSVTEPCNRIILYVSMDNVLLTQMQKEKRVERERERERWKWRERHNKKVICDNHIIFDGSWSVHFLNDSTSDDILHVNQREFEGSNYISIWFVLFMYLIFCASYNDVDRNMILPILKFSVRQLFAL